MRGFLVLLGLIALVVVVLISLGMLKIQQTGNATLPTVTFDMKGGHLPSFKTETGTVGVGTTNTTVQVPSVEMKNTTVTLPTIEVKQAGNTTAPAKQ
ncbi:MAG: hypothetical protein WDN44_05830 [Sphingomonas sp.]